jgi:hypothetical protein
MSPARMTPQVSAEDYVSVIVPEGILTGALFRARSFYKKSGYTEYEVIYRRTV